MGKSAYVAGFRVGSGKGMNGKNAGKSVILRGKWGFVNRMLGFVGDSAVKAVIVKVGWVL